MNARKPRAAGDVVPSLAARHQNPIEWLEADYDQPGAFRYPVGEDIHTPRGLFQVVADHPTDCRCEADEGEFWLSGDAAAKWRAS